MKQQFTDAFLFVFTCLCFLSSCQKETAPVPENRIDMPTAKKSDANSMVPIKGTYETTNEVLHGPPMLQQRITGVGQSSHLGEGKFVAISTLNLTTAPPFQLAGTATFYAANGDVFYTSFAGTSTPSTGGTSIVIMTHTITGGTGRFENATGTLIGHAVANPSRPTGTVTYDGTISY